MDGCFLRDHSPLLADAKRSILKVAFSGSHLTSHPLASFGAASVASSPVLALSLLGRSGCFLGSFGYVRSSLFGPPPLRHENGQPAGTCVEGGAIASAIRSQVEWGLPVAGLSVSPVFCPDSLRDFDELMC